MAESRALSFGKQAGTGEKRSRLQSLSSAYHEFLDRIYWGYHAGEEGGAHDDDLDVGGIVVVGEGGG
jgi:hypothetical protein